MGILVKILLITSVLEWSSFQSRADFPMDEVVKMGPLRGVRRRSTAARPSEEKPADEMVTRLLQLLQSSMIEDGILSDSRKNALTPISFKSQIIDESSETTTAYFIKAEIGENCAILRITYKKPSDLMIQNGDKGVILHEIEKVNSCEKEIEMFDPSNPETDPDKKDIQHGEEYADHKIKILVRKVQSQMKSYGISTNFKSNDLAPISFKEMEGKDGGKIYVVKVKDKGEGKCVVMRIYNQPSRTGPQMQEVKESATLDGMKNIRSCKEEINFFEPESGIQKEIGPFGKMKPVGKEIEDVVKHVESQMRSYGYYSDDGPSFNMIYYVAQVVDKTKIYFVKASLRMNLNKCYWLRISEKIGNPVKKTEKTVSLDGIKRMKSCEDDFEYFEPEGKQMKGGEQSNEIPYNDNDKNVLEIISEVETPLSLHEIYNVRNQCVKPISYLSKKTATRTIYFIKAFHKDEGGECFLLRIHEKLSRMVKTGEKRASLEGVKKINSCKDKIEQFEPDQDKQSKVSGSLDEKPGDGEINDIVEQAMPFDFFESLNFQVVTIASSKLEVISYKEKISSEGKIYFVKAYYKSEGVCLLLRITKIRTKVSLDGKQWMDSCKDEIDLFEPDREVKLSQEVRADQKISRVLTNIVSEMSTKYDFFPEMREFFSNGELEALSFKRQIEGYDKFGGSVAFFVKVLNRTKGKCFEFMIVISSSILSEKRHETDYMAKFRGMKKMKSCRDEIKYFNILKPETIIKEIIENKQETTIKEIIENSPERNEDFDMGAFQ